MNDKNKIMLDEKGHLIARQVNGVMLDEKGHNIARYIEGSDRTIDGTGHNVGKGDQRERQIGK